MKTSKNMSNSAQPLDDESRIKPLLVRERYHRESCR